MSHVAVALVDKGGEVETANTSAVRLLGWFRGRKCHEFVGACDASGRPVCTRQCVLMLEGHAARQRDQLVAVREQPFRLVCTALDEKTVVTLIPEPASAKGTTPLSVREREVLDLVAEGLNTRAIARRLGLSTATVRTHVEHARAKLGARTRAEAVARTR